ncbi:MAG TPA: hypothetical protein VIM70_03590 [Clostridium sp.]|uniref:hypothetical protein n=1 Tax=Clostridium sp. TaxID=1506 RepID=UPI002F92A692
MNEIKKIIEKITKLREEIIKISKNGGYTQEEAKEIQERTSKIKTKVERLKEKLLFEQYIELQSNEFKEDLIGYKKFKEPGKVMCIKVSFTWGWLRVYRNNTNSIEWY